MAFRSNGPISVVLPPFRGVTRRIILTAVGVFFALLVLGLFLREGAALMGSLLALSPSTSYKLLWQLISYPFVNGAIFSLLFAAISVWFFGSTLEDELGSRWMGEFFVATTIGGGVLAILCVLVFGRLLSIPSLTMASGLWPFSLALLMVFASLHAEQELNFNFILRLKAKYIAIIYLLVYLAVALASHERFDAVLVLANSLWRAGCFCALPRAAVCGFAAKEGALWFEAMRGIRAQAPSRGKEVQLSTCRSRAGRSSSTRAVATWTRTASRATLTTGAG